VDGGDAAVLDDKLLMDHLDHWRQAVGGAAGCCDDVVDIWLVILLQQEGIMKAASDRDVKSRLRHATGTAGVYAATARAATIVCSKSQHSAWHTQHSVHRSAVTARGKARSAST
jgi:hypothetical protein